MASDGGGGDVMDMYQHLPANVRYVLTLVRWVGDCGSGTEMGWCDDGEVMV